MNKKELIKAMKNIPDDEEIFIGADGVYPIEKAERDVSGDNEFIIIADEENEIFANLHETNNT